MRSGGLVVWLFGLLHFPQELLHLVYPAGLRGDYSVQYRANLPAQRILQGVLGHENRAAVMRYHLPHEVRGYAARSAGALHLLEHYPGDIPEAPLIAAQLLAAVLHLGAALQRGLHVLYAFGLRCDYVLCDTPHRSEPGVLKQVPGHLNCGAVVRYHLHDKVLRYAAPKLRVGHFVNHCIEDLTVAAEVLRGSAFCCVHRRLLSEF